MGCHPWRRTSMTPRGATRILKARTLNGTQTTWARFWGGKTELLCQVQQPQFTPVQQPQSTRAERTGVISNQSLRGTSVTSEVSLGLDIIGGESTAAAGDQGVREEGQVSSVSAVQSSAAHEHSTPHAAYGSSSSSCQTQQRNSRNDAKHPNPGDSRDV